MTPDDIAAMEAHDAEVDKAFRKLERQRADLTAKNIQLRADIAKLTADRDADRAEIVALCEERLQLIAERDEARAALYRVRAVADELIAACVAIGVDPADIGDFYDHGDAIRAIAARRFLAALDGSGT